MRLHSRRENKTQIISLPSKQMVKSQRHILEKETIRFLKWVALIERMKRNAEIILIGKHTGTQYIIHQN